MDQQNPPSPSPSGNNQVPSDPSVENNASSVKKTNLYLLIGIIVCIILALSIGLYFFASTTLTNTSRTAQQTTALPTFTPTPTVPLKTEYSNPFDEKSSYENPFASSDEYQNPFDTGQ